MSKQKEKPFEIKWKTDLPYRYSIGKLSVKFFEELKENPLELLFLQEDSPQRKEEVYLTLY